jgi:D-arabinose 1-dehydrogenase-like Zn-dependent alcohol dehydrogenase
VDRTVTVKRVTLVRGAFRVLQERVRLYGDGEVRFEIWTANACSPRAGHVRVRPEVVGVCATDLEILDGSLIYYRSGKAAYPITPGHEWAGIVEAILNKSLRFS